MNKVFSLTRRILKRNAPCVLSFTIVGIVILFLFVVKGCLCFGNNTFATQDAYYQYIDFFSWYKDWLSGKYALNYTFTKELGGTAIPLFAYYLASPFNLLFAAFQKGSAPAFIDLLFSIKSMVAAYTFTYFLRKRFIELCPVYSIVLGIGYGLMEYNIAQSSNTMWLDGVYMLPLMILGVYFCVNKRQVAFLAMTTGLSVLFNWYTGGINCLFAIIWFIFEMVVAYSNKIVSSTKNVFTSVIRFISALSLGVLISSVLFLPSVIALRSGEGASFDWADVHSSFMGNVLTVVQNHTLGSFSEAGSVSLFCGSFSLITIVHMFRDKTVSLSEKIRNGSLLSFGILMFYYEPLFFIFSLFKSGEGFWYRYSYLGCFIVLYVAAKELNRKKEYEHKQNFVIDGAIVSGLLLFLSYCIPKWDMNRVYATIAFIWLMVFLDLLFFKTKKHKYIAATTLIILCSIELFFNAYYLVDNFVMDNGNEYARYISNLETSLDEIRNLDQGYYRISQTYHRQGNISYSLTVNDSMAGGFAGISGYSSLSENIQTELESNMGYNCWGGNLQVVLTSIIPTDSLLGVKYIISNYSIPGLNCIGDSSLSPECCLYENPYALPLVFSVRGNADAISNFDNSSPFEYVNDMYSSLVGRRVEVFKPVDTIHTVNNNTDSFDINVSANDTLYGYVNNYSFGLVRINGSDWVHLGEWQAQTLFYVPIWSDQGNMNVSIESLVPGVFSDTQFYKVDLEELQSVTEELKAYDSVEDLSIEDGYVVCNVNPTEESYLQTTIPSSAGWSAYVNGRATEIISFADGLIRVPIHEGDNTVVLKYKTPGATGGVVITIISMLVVTYLGVVEFRRENHDMKNENTSEGASKNG